MAAFRMVFRVTRAFVLAGLIGGLTLGLLAPLLLLPVLLLGTLVGMPLQLGTLAIIAAVGSITGTIVGLAVGLIVGLLSSVLTLVFFRARIGTRGHRMTIRLATVTTAAMLMFVGVFALTGSTDMSSSSVVFWRVPSALVAALYGWWLSGRMLRNESVWQLAPIPDDTPLYKPWEYGPG